jgi:hypothetical protein
VLLLVAAISLDLLYDCGTSSLLDLQELQEQITRLPDQLAELPAFRDSLAGEESMLERVFVTAGST